MREQLKAPSHTTLRERLKKPSHTIVREQLKEPSHATVREQLKEPSHTTVREQLKEPMFKICYCRGGRTESKTKYKRVEKTAVLGGLEIGSGKNSIELNLFLKKSSAKLGQNEG